MTFTIVNGQIYTPGLAIVNAPQPYTPLGGDNLHVSIDVSGNGRLSLSSDDAPTRFHEIQLFLTSAEKEKNLTISNGTSADPASGEAGYVGPVLDLEPSSTVKHINWIWPGCFVGEGGGDGGSDSARGNYNISMHQSFRWNGTDYYTVFDLPISVSNGIAEDEDRVDCGLLQNGYRPGLVVASNASIPGQPWVGEDGQVVVLDENDGARRKSVKGHGLWMVFVLVMALVL
ncbi:hypothetical protein BDW62DRAFT_213881 [Aspergillus aurantiobrunneus]